MKKKYCECGIEIFGKAKRCAECAKKRQALLHAESARKQAALKRAKKEMPKPQSGGLDAFALEMKEYNDRQRAEGKPILSYGKFAALHAARKAALKPLNTQTNE